MKKVFNIKTMCITAGAFVSYSVGAAFASGNEILQFFGSWGEDTWIAWIAGFLTTALYCVCLYIIGQHVQFEKSADTYMFFGGKIVGRIYQVCVGIFLIGTSMLLFSGAGSLLQQELGFPSWVGAVLLAVISIVVVLGGLKTVENVLGYAGILILAYIAVFGIISLINPGSNFNQATGVAEMVAEGKVWQANMFALPPFNWFPVLSEFNSPVIEGILYGALCVVTGFPFYLSLGRRSTNRKEAVGSGILTTVAFYLCIALVLLLILRNFNTIINPATGEMYAFPAVAVINTLWPSGGWTYVIIIFVGIFTTLSGFLWATNNMFFEGREKTWKSRMFVIVLTVFGMCFGSALPFSQIINILQPLSGVVGVIMIVSIVVKTISFLYKKQESDIENIDSIVKIKKE